MIDAYEIGIQLALQDGVSAGLEVIGRELAEVDRAVAATSAGLQSLTLAAQGAVRAASAATGVQIPATAQVPSTEDESQAATQTQVPARLPPRPLAGSTAPVAEVQVAGQGTVATHTAPASLVREPASAAPRRVTVSAPVIAPQSFPAIAPVEAGRSVAPRRSAPAPELVFHAEKPEPSATVISEVPSSPQAIAPVASAQEREPMRASLAQAIAPRARREAILGTGQGPRAVPFNVAATVPRSAATPGSAGESGAAAPRGAGITESAVAPRPRPRHDGNNDMGSVMLDGRLVGYWLSEQMAREASRPPGGTSFFDPRQTPAWTPSGAL